MLTTYLVGLAAGSIIMGAGGSYPQLLRHSSGTIIGNAVLLRRSDRPVAEKFIGYFSADTPWRTVMLLEFAVCFVTFIPAFAAACYSSGRKDFMRQRQFRIGRTIATPTP